MSKKGVMRVEVWLLCVVLAGAAWTDVRQGRIRNWWLSAAAAAGLWCRGADFLPGAVVVLVLSFPLFRLRLMGAGDGKLMAVMAGYLGMEAGIEAIGAGMAVGALWSLCILAREGSLKERMTGLFLYFRQALQTGAVRARGVWTERRRGPSIPLGACMAAGTYLYLLVSGIMAVWGVR